MCAKKCEYLTLLYQNMLNSYNTMRIIIDDYTNQIDLRICLIIITIYKTIF